LCISSSNLTAYFLFCIGQFACYNRKVATIVATVVAGVSSVYSDYDLPAEKHVFSDVQDRTRQFVDAYVYGIKRDTAPANEPSEAKRDR
jgi:hypothetical protein